MQKHKKAISSGVIAVTLMLNSILGTSPVRTAAITSTQTVQVLINTSARDKTYSSYTNAYTAVQKLSSKSKAQYTSQLNKIYSAIPQAKDISDIVSRINKFKKTQNARDYFAIQSVINKTIKKSQDKAYLLRELNIGRVIMLKQKGYQTVEKAVMVDIPNLIDKHDYAGANKAMVVARKMVAALSHKDNQKYFTESLNNSSARLDEYTAAKAGWAMGEFKTYINAGWPIEAREFMPKTKNYISQISNEAKRILIIQRPASFKLIPGITKVVVNDSASKILDLNGKPMTTIGTILVKKNTGICSKVPVFGDIVIDKTANNEVNTLNYSSMPHTLLKLKTSIPTMHEDMLYYKVYSASSPNTGSNCIGGKNAADKSCDQTIPLGDFIDSFPDGDIVIEAWIVDWHGAISDVAKTTIKKVH